MVDDYGGCLFFWWMIMVEGKPYSCCCSSFLLILGDVLSPLSYKSESSYLSLGVSSFRQRVLSPAPAAAQWPWWWLDLLATASELSGPDFSKRCGDQVMKIPQKTIGVEARMNNDASTIGPNGATNKKCYVTLLPSIPPWRHLPRFLDSVLCTSWWDVSWAPVSDTMWHPPIGLLGLHLAASSGISARKTKHQMACRADCAARLTLVRLLQGSMQFLIPGKSTNHIMNPGGECWQCKKNAQTSHIIRDMRMNKRMRPLCHLKKAFHTVPNIYIHRFVQLWDRWEFTETLGANALTEALIERKRSLRGRFDNLTMI